MKKVLLGLALIATMVAFSSCEKECSCTVKYTGATEGLGLSDYTSTMKAKKCADAESTSTSFGVTTTITCK